MFNLFVVSVFWSVVVDTFDGDQGRRLFGVLAAGATFGGLLGSALTSSLAAHVGRTSLLLLAVALIEVAVLASRRLSRVSRRSGAGPAEPDRPVGGGIFSGMVRTFRSPYLLGLAACLFIYSLTSTFLYFEQARIA